MASILDRYGIKEVADVTFYHINDSGEPDYPVLFLDTLKVSTIEQTAEQVDARGGKGNPKLITWDYGKEISVTIEDALFSPKSLAIMMGNGAVSAKASGTVKRTIMARVEGAAGSGTIDYLTADVYDANEKGAVRKKIDMKTAQADSTNPRAGMINFASAGITVTGITTASGSALADPSIGDGWTYNEIKTVVAPYGGDKVFITYTQPVQQTELVVSGDTFPGTYYITGDTYARSDVTGKDSFFQFIIPKAKMSAEQTITLEAEGDPTTFNMNLTVLRPESGEMMKLVQYDLEATAG